MLSRKTARPLFDAGMNAYAAKPIEVAKLLNVLAQTLDVE